MDWGLTAEASSAPFGDMDFCFDDDDLFDFGTANETGPQFAAAMFDLRNQQYIDPALVSPELDSEPSADGTVGELGTRLAPQQQLHQKISQRRSRKGPAYVPPGLATGISNGTILLHGQITPPQSNTDSPPLALLDTIDPVAIMPTNDETKTDIDGLDLSTDPKLFPPAPNSPVKESAPAPKAEPSTSTAQLPAKPKSKRGRKKKILAPAARDAQRARTLARNRAAAQRCRQRKKVEHSALEAKARNLTKERARLTMLVGGLRDELLSLKGAMLSHASCAEMDGNVARYVREQREMLMAGMPLEDKNSELSQLLDEFQTEDRDESDEDDEDEGESEDEDGEDEDGEGDEDDETPTAASSAHQAPVTGGAADRRTRNYRQRRN